MRHLTLIIMLIAATGLWAGDLAQAYTEEYTYLKAQKNALQKQVARESSMQKRDLLRFKSKIEALQQQLITLTNESKKVESTLEKINKKIDEAQDNSALIEDVLAQAKMTFDTYHIKSELPEKASLTQKLDEIFTKSIGLYKKLSSIDKTHGKYFLTDGTATEGEIVKVGNIARYGISPKGSGALAPAGDGAFKLWNQPGSDVTAKALAAGKRPETLKIFVYENDQKDVPYTKEKTFQDYLDGGGVIGYIILALGALGLLLALLRALFLMGAGSRVSKITEIVEEQFKNGGTPEDALNAIKGYKGATARVIKTTIRNLGKDRGHIEDIVTEAMLNESMSLDRFGSFIMVIAAVAPLLGLLGTVTGMIATFDVITEHGTGDPKLLSGGISEALVTTMFGLIVAIPLLLIGNLLSSWANSIKASMEGAALHIVNLYEKYTKQ